MRNYKNTLGYLELLARQNSENIATQQANQIAAERRAAEYEGVNRMMKGVGEQMERNRSADVKLANAKGLGFAVDGAGRPQEVGDLELDAAMQAGYETHRSRIEMADRAHQALLGRVLATRPHQQAMEETARMQAEAATQRALDQGKNARERNKLTAERDAATVQRDKATALYHELLARNGRVSAGASATRASASSRDAATREAQAKSKSIHGTNVKSTKLRNADGSQKVLPADPQAVAADRAIREAQAAELGVSLPPEDIEMAPVPGAVPGGGGDDLAEERIRLLRQKAFGR